MSKRHPLIGGIIAVAAIVASGSIARADLAPPPSYGQSCSVKREATKDTPCESCAVDYRKPKRCAGPMGEKGLAFRCRTPGRTAWSEVWCRSDDAPDGSAPSAEPDAAAGGGSPATSAPPPEPSSSPASEPASSPLGCAVTAPGQPTSNIMFLLLALCAGWARRPQPSRSVGRSR